MSSSGPFPEGNPFEGLPIFGDLARMFSEQGPINWDVAQQLARWVATDGQPEGNVDPLERMRLEELIRVADLQVSAATGLATSVTGNVLTVTPVTRGEWARQGLQAYRPLLERLARSLANGSETGPDPTTELLGSLGALLGPVLLGMQGGFMLGHLARRSLGQYDLPIPRPPSDELLVVSANLDQLADDWSLDGDDLRLWVCLHEVLHHAVLGRPHVRARLEHLIGEYVSSFQLDPGALEANLGEVDLSDPSGLQVVLGRPESLLGAMQTDAQRDLMVQIETLTAALGGYVDHVMDDVGGRLIGSYGMLTEALRRRRVEASEADHFVERLLGVELRQAQYNKGEAFVAGVVDRAGEDGLRRLWVSAKELPTPSELEAPGLWLARIDLPDAPDQPTASA